MLKNEVIRLSVLGLKLVIILNIISSSISPEMEHASPPLHHHFLLVVILLEHWKKI
jgi:hypothetical protein